MSDGFEVDPTELTTHAHTLSGIADGVAECRAASDQEGVGGQVYGDLFDPTILPILWLMKEAYAALITGAANVGHGISNTLQANGDRYTSNDEDALKIFTGIASYAQPPWAGH